MSSMNAAFRLSALVIAAGTILGLSSNALAQSRLERAEKALAQAQKELDAARREAGRGPEAGQIEINCDGCNAACDADCNADCNLNCDDQRADITADDDDDQPRKIERRIEIRRGGPAHGDSHGDSHAHPCPFCGHMMEDGAQGMGGGNAKFKAFSIGGPKGAIPGMPGMKVFRFGDGEGSGPVRVEGKVIVLNGEGEGHEFNLGGAHGQAFTIRGDGDQGGQVKKRIEIRRKGGDEGGAFFMEGDGLKKQQRIELRGMPEGGEPRVFIEGGPGQKHHVEIRRGEGAHGVGNIEVPGFRMDGGGAGKVIIITPDGQRREFNFGGGKGGKQVQIERFGDGEDAAAHPDGQGDKTVRVRRVIRGSAL